MSFQQAQQDEEQRRQEERCEGCIGTSAEPCHTTLKGAYPIHLGCRRYALEGYADAGPTQYGRTYEYHGPQIKRDTDGEATYYREQRLK